jgi:thiol-disulfide isomerase/thioredoxin
MNLFKKLGKRIKSLARASIYGTLISASMLTPAESYASIGKDIQDAIQKITLTENRKEDMQKEVDKLSAKYDDDYFFKPDRSPSARTCFTCNLLEERATMETNRDLRKLQKYQEKLDMPDSTVNKTKRLLMYSLFLSGFHYGNDHFEYTKSRATKNKLINNRLFNWISDEFAFQKEVNLELDARDLANEIMKSDSAFGKRDDFMNLHCKTMSIIELRQGDPEGSSSEKFVNKEVPEISATYWVNSKPLKLKDLRGKVVLLDFWSTMCGPCVDALPEVKKLWQKYKDKEFVVIGIHNSAADTSNAREFIEKNGITYPIAIDRSTGESYDVQTIPQFWLIDKQGKFRPTASIESLLEEPYTK